MAVIYDIAEQYNEAVLGNDSAALAELAKSYLATYSFIMDEYGKVKKKALEAAAQGKPISPAWAFQEKRFATMAKQIETVIAGLTVKSQSAIVSAQIDGLKQGREGAYAQIDSMLGPNAPGAKESGVVAHFTKLSEQTIQSMQAFFHAQTPYRNTQLLKAASSDTFNKVRQHMVVGIGAGLPVQITAKKIKAELNTEQWKAERFVRTERFRAYRAATQVTFEQNRGTVKGWRWLAHLGKNTCSVCLAMNGTEHPVGEPMGTHPNCRCSQVAITASWEDLGGEIGEIDTTVKPPDGEMWLLTQPESTQLAVLGQSKLDHWQAGNFDLVDTINLKHSPEWGITRSEAGLSQTLAQAAARKAAEAQQRAAALAQAAALRKQASDAAKAAHRAAEEAAALAEKLAAAKSNANEDLLLSLLSEPSVRTLTAVAAPKFIADNGDFLPLTKAKYKTLTLSQEKDYLIAAATKEKGIIAYYKKTAAWTEIIDAEAMKEAEAYAAADKAKQRQILADRAAAILQAKQDAAAAMQAQPSPLYAIPHAELLKKNESEYEPTWDDPSTNHLRQAYGSVIIDNLGRVLLREPTNHFDGYHWTFAKGGKGYGEHGLETALRETEEETGYTGQVVGFVPGVFKGGTSANKYYLMRAEAFQQSAIGPETAGTRWATPDEARALIGESTNDTGRARDIAILDAAIARHAEILAGTVDYSNIKPEVKKRGRPAGSKNKPKAIPEAPPVASADVAGYLAGEAATREALFADTLPSRLVTIRGLGGSTGAELVKDTVTGIQYVRKYGSDADHLREECTTDEAYRALGVPVPEFRLYDDGTARPVKLSRYLEGSVALASVKSDPSETAKLIPHFAADALLGNWDVIGLSYDNVLFSGGVPYRVDNGGGLRFRAMGGRKTAEQWNEHPVELWSLRDKKANAQTAEIFGSAEFYKSVAAGIPALVARRDYLAAVLPAEVRDTVLKRLDYLADTYKVAQTLESDKWRDGYGDGFTKHIVGLRKAGFHDGLPKELINDRSNATVIRDENGKYFDSMRDKDGLLSVIEKYAISQQASWQAVANWGASQGGSQWSTEAVSAKYFFAISRTVAFSKYYTGGGESWQKDKYETNSANYGKEEYNAGLLIAHVMTYETLRNVKFRNGDAANQTVKGMIRTESYNDVLATQGIKNGDKNKQIVRGASESFSIFEEFRYKGNTVTRQDMPYIRCLLPYWYSRTSASAHAMNGMLAGDDGNEFVCMAEGIPTNVDR